MLDYTKQFWINGPDGQTPVNATRMNHMEDGIAAASVEEVLVLEVGGTVPPETPIGTVIVQKLV